MINYEALLQTLKENSDPKLRSFNSRLNSAVSHDYGVKVPVLRKIAKSLVKDDWRSFLSIARDDTQEEIMLQGMVIACSPCSFEEKLSLTEGYIPKISNWALCDVFCGSFKIKQEKLNRLYDFLQPYLNSKQEFECRFAVVMLMDYFIRDETIDQVLSHLIAIENNTYYTRMAIAWALSKAYIDYPEKTLAILQSGKLDAFTHNKAIQKMIESYRISEEDKKMLRTYKTDPKK